MSDVSTDSQVDFEIILHEVETMATPDDVISDGEWADAASSRRRRHGRRADRPRIRGADNRSSALGRRRATRVPGAERRRRANRESDSWRQCRRQQYCTSERDTYVRRRNRDDRADRSITGHATGPVRDDAHRLGDRYGDCRTQAGGQHDNRRARLLAADRRTQVRDVGPSAGRR